MIQDHHLHTLQDFESLGASMSGIWLFAVFVFVLIEDTLLFALTYSPTCGNSQSKTNVLMTV